MWFFSRQSCLPFSLKDTLVLVLILIEVWLQQLLYKVSFCFNPEQKMNAVFRKNCFSVKVCEQFTGQQSWVLSLLAMHIPTYGMMNRFHLIMRIGLRQSQA